MAGPSLYRRAIVLGLLIAIGAFAIDMYIPGFAAIAADLHTDPGTVQLSMTSFFVALGAGQIDLRPGVGQHRPPVARSSSASASSPSPPSVLPSPPPSKR